MSKETVEYCKSVVHGKKRAEISAEARLLARKYPWAGGEGMCHLCIRNRVVMLIREKREQDLLEAAFRHHKVALPPRRLIEKLKPEETTLVKTAAVLRLTTEAVRDRLLKSEPPEEPFLRSRRLADGPGTIAIERDSISEFLGLISRNSPALERLSPALRESLTVTLGITRRRIANGGLD
jgi:hypothetical protein